MLSDNFKSENGLLHYFVRPYDHFVLDTLEKFNYDEYTYKLLKEQGYDRVVFCENAGNKCAFTAFDKLSHLSFSNYVDFAKIDLFNKSDLQSFYKRVKEKDQKTQNALKGLERGKPIKKAPVEEKGKRVVKELDTQAELINDFSQNCSAFLKYDKGKSALVMELSVLKRLLDIERNSAIRTGACLYSLIENVHKSNYLKNNILVIAVKERDELYELLTDSSLALMHDIVNRVSDSGCRSNYVSKAIEELEKIGCITLAESVGYDEIANVIFRKKLIDENEAFQKIPTNKVYPLAKVIKNHIVNGSKEFKNSPANFCGSKDYINTFEAFLRDKAFVSELVECCKNLKAGNTKAITKKGVDVERVRGTHIHYIENTDYEDILAEFDSLVGMENVKEEFHNVVMTILGDIEKYEKNELKEVPFTNMLLLGPPGTCKSTCGDIMARAMAAKGIVANPEYYVVEPGKYHSDGAVGRVGGNLGRDLEAHKGCVVFMDEVYGFDEGYSNGNIGNEVWSAVLNATNHGRESADTRTIFIFAGYEKETMAFMDLNVGGARRFPHVIKMEHYTEDQLVEILQRMGKEYDFSAITEPLKKVFTALKNEKGDKFGNGGEAQNMLTQLEKARKKRKNAGNEFLLKDLLRAFPQYKAIITDNQESYDEILKSFDRFVGLDAIKKMIIERINFIKRKKKEYELADDKSEVEFPRMGMCFEGPPGVGKTEGAGVVARLLCEAGILSNPIPVIARPEQFSGGGVIDKKGDKMKKFIDEHNGSVIVFDEVSNYFKPYGNGGNAGNEAVEAFMYAADTYRDSMCLILCGYKNETERVIGLNPGMHRRFPKTIVFESYSTDVLIEIFQKKIADKYNADNIIPLVRRVIDYERDHAKENFGNAGFVVDKLVPDLEERYFARDAEDGVFTEDDVTNAFPEVFANGVELDKPTYEKIDGVELLNLPNAYEKRNYEDCMSELYNHTKSGILYLETDKGFGTGFIVSPDGYALTCNHVVEGSSKCTARLRVEGRPGGNDSFHNCTVIKTDKALDIALIKLEGCNFPYLNIAPLNRTPEVFEKYILSGYPFGKRTQGSLTSFNGYIATGDAKQMDENGLVRYMLNGEGKCGNSGSPIVSVKDGSVIGILLGSITNSASGSLVEEINYMRPISYFWEHFTK